VPEDIVLAYTPPWLPVDAAAITLGVLIEAPLCIWGNLKTFSTFAAAGVVSTTVVTSLVVVLPLIDPHKQHVDEQSEHHILGNWPDVFSATGIMAVRPSPSDHGKHNTVIACYSGPLCPQTNIYRRTGNYSSTLIIHKLPLTGKHSHTTCMGPLMIHTSRPYDCKSSKSQTAHCSHIGKKRNYSSPR
jgi:hypothetical protein